MQLTDHQAKYFAYDLTRKSTSGLDRLSMALFDAAVDLNPHQIEAALFALQSPLSKGVILCDEVGLGKTIEAGIVLCQLWAERKRRILIICPASIRKQWALELEEKFNLPTFVLDAKSYRESRKMAEHPLDRRAVVIASFHYANRIRDDIKSVAWDTVVIDEAHKLRNAYRPSNKMGQGLRWATEGCRKLLLTATPLQNSLLELYGLSTLIDEHIFGDVNAFRAQFMGAGGSLSALRGRLNSFAKRTLRKDVLEYIRYTERRALTQPFRPTDDEQNFYEAVSRFLQEPDSYSIPSKQRHLLQLILHKLLASSSHAIAGTLDRMRTRLEDLRDEQLTNDLAFAESLIGGEEFEDDLLDEILDEEPDAEDDPKEPEVIDRAKLNQEITELEQLSKWAKGFSHDTKSASLLTALNVGFTQMESVGANRKALIFTESRRTQDYLKEYLEEHGNRGKVAIFNGTNSGAEAKAIYEQWIAKNMGSGRSSGSRQIDIRMALIEHFRDEGTILIATEAAAEGVNMQFCSLVINYDLPWNPQRVEQRIGRCHRYGQKHDVVVINFLNERNAADRRVLELLGEKFRLFNGVFGSSDDVLGSIESGMDFEKRILSIYQECRTEDEIDSRFDQLRNELEEQIQSRMSDTREILLEHFDEDVHQRLRLQLKNAQDQLDKFGKRFWAVTGHVLSNCASFDDENLAFDLLRSPVQNAPEGRYHLVSKNPRNDKEQARPGKDSFLYRLSHPLGEHVLETAKELDAPLAQLSFDISNHSTKISVVESMRGQKGWLRLNRLVIDSYEREEYLLFSGMTTEGKSVDQETCEKLLSCIASAGEGMEAPDSIQTTLDAESTRHAEATISGSLEENSEHFRLAREKLEQWSDDMVLAAEKALKDTKEQIKALRRQSRQAASLDEQHEVLKKVQSLEKQQRRQRKEIFQVEDEIVEKRDALIDQLEKRMVQATRSETIFTVAWQVI
jgi:hypothetical protein